MAQILKGVPVMAEMTERTRAEAAQLNEKGIEPCLMTIRVGVRGDDIAYENSIAKRCEKAGVLLRKTVLDEQASQEAILEAVLCANEDKSVHGVLIFRPLPKGIDDEVVRNALLPSKDVDGITDLSLAGVFTGAERFAPCTAQACIEMLDHYKIDPTGKRVVIIGRSLTVGRPLALMLIKRHATVTVCHTRTKEIDKLCREAEIIIAAAGSAQMVDKRYMQKGQIIIDVGVNVADDGSLCGDVVFADAENIAGAVSPVPGGVGMITAGVLVSHTVKAAKAQ